MKYITYMPTKKPQILLTFPEDDLLKLIDDWRFNNRINSRSEAVRQLIKKGLKNSKKQIKKR